MRCRKVFWIVVVLLCVGGTSAYVLRRPILRTLATTLVTDDPLERADAVFILAGEYPARVLEGADLIREGYARLVILSRDVEEPAFEVLRRRGIGPEQAPTRNDLNRGLLLALGVPKADVKIMPRLLRRTTEEARDIVRVVHQVGGVHRLIVVTSPAHSGRARRLMREAFKDSGIEVRIRVSRYEPLDPDRWWKDNSQRRAVGHEWLAMLAAPLSRP